MLAKELSGVSFAHISSFCQIACQGTFHKGIWWCTGCWFFLNNYLFLSFSWGKKSKLSGDFFALSAQRQFSGEHLSPLGDPAGRLNSS